MPRAQWARLIWIIALAVAACRSGEDDTRSGLDVASAPDAAAADTEPAPPVGLRIGTWNVLRLFDTTCDSGDCTAGAFEEVPSATGFDQKVSQVAAGVEALAADVVGLQEIENEVAFDALVDRLGWPPSRALLAETGAPASVDVAGLTTGTIDAVRRHQDTPIDLPGGGTTTFSRELLELDLRVGAQRVIAFVAHFRSKNNDDPDRRLAEAMAARAIVLTAARDAPDALVVLVGDLNDTPGSPPIEALVAGGALEAAYDHLDASDAWTYRFGGEGRMLDHVLWVPGGRCAPIDGGVRVHRSAGATHAGSDHSAVTVDFRCE